MVGWMEFTECGLEVVRLIIALSVRSMEFGAAWKGPSRRSYT
jgi:hypothetical protein